MKYFRKLNLRDFRSKYRKVVNLVAMIVVFVTTYALYSVKIKNSGSPVSMYN